MRASRESTEAIGIVGEPVGGSGACGDECGDECADECEGEGGDACVNERGYGQARDCCGKAGNPTCSMVVKARLRRLSIASVCMSTLGKEERVCTEMESSACSAALEISVEGILSARR